MRQFKTSGKDTRAVGSTELKTDGKLRVEGDNRRGVEISKSG